MPVTLQHEEGTPYVEVTMSGKVDEEDYRKVVPGIEDMMEEFGKLNMLIRLEQFKGWTGQALWRELKFDIDHAADAERIAVVGERGWEQTAASFSGIFTPAVVRYFSAEERTKAETWLKKHQLEAFN